MDKHYRCAGRVRQPIMSKACKSQKKTPGASLRSCLPGLDYCLLVILDHAVVACWSLEERPQAAAVVLSRARLMLCTICSSTSCVQQQQEPQAAQCTAVVSQQSSSCMQVVYDLQQQPQAAEWFSGSRAENSYFPSRSCSTCPRAATILRTP